MRDIKNSYGIIHQRDKKIPFIYLSATRKREIFNLSFSIRSGYMYPHIPFYIKHSIVALYKQPHIYRYLNLYNECIWYSELIFLRLFNHIIYLWYHNQWSLPFFYKADKGQACGHTVQFHFRLHQQGIILFPRISLARRHIKPQPN